MYYHGTPLLFNVLQAGSWLSSSIEEACLHLFMKNNSEQRDGLFGHILIFHNVPAHYISNKVSFGTYENVLTNGRMGLGNPLFKERISFRDALAMIDPKLRPMFTNSQVVDLKPLLFSPS